MAFDAKWFLKAEGWLVFTLDCLQEEPPDFSVVQTGGEELRLWEDPVPVHVDHLKYFPGGELEVQRLAGGGGAGQGQDISDHLERLPGIQHSVTVNVVQPECPLEWNKL